MEEAVRCILRAKRCVVFSGAGASADSGIGTFRGAGGAWSGLTGAIALAWGGTPIGWRWTPGLVWSKFVSDFYQPIADASPHDGLVALTELQQRCFDGPERMRFITMNVDSLHQAAGSQGVAEVHGSVRRFRCMSCGNVAQPDLPLRASRQPRCSDSGCGGRIRPDVTLFTEGLPGDQWELAEEAVNLLRPGDVMLVVGTSSVVYPAADLPGIAKRRGATLIEFNLEVPTPLSDIVDIAVPGRAAETLRQCVDAVLQGCAGGARQR
mmetsp:Transcript_9911/g.26172  ORF Transcript_9911/g.26172 Transcript_9911/m.26172 type:complete len:266 (-) Transcript_9911:21-818(-)